jgi:hypothetical protein
MAFTRDRDSDSVLAIGYWISSDRNPDELVVEIKLFTILLESLVCALGSHIVTRNSDVHSCI